MKTTIDKKFFEKWKDKKVAMHCKTHDEAKTFCKILEHHGYKWAHGEVYGLPDGWEIFKKDTVYCFNTGYIESLKTAKNAGRIILEFEDYIIKEESVQEIVPKNVIYHEAICTMLNKMYEEKNSDYGNNFAKVRKEFPNSILIRLSDKLERLKTLYKQEAKVKDESIEDTLMDLANYAIMELVERKMDNE